MLLIVYSIKKKLLSTYVDRKDSVRIASHDQQQASRIHLITFAPLRAEHELLTPYNCCRYVDK